MVSLQIEGGVYQRDQDEFEASRTRNFATSAHCRNDSKPALIVEAASVKDIQACVEYARQKDLQVTVRTGGHNYFGSSVREDCVLLDMSRFDSMDIDTTNQTATVGPALLGKQLNSAAASHGLCFPTGHCPGVPLGGFLLGGGFGWFSCHFGLAAESILAATIVTGAGEVIQANDENYPDWMWLVRGSASAFPGVIVSFTLKLHPLPSIIRSASSIHSVEDFEAIASFIQAGRLDGSLSSKVEMTAILAFTPPPLHELITPDTICIYSLSFSADSEDEFEAQLEAAKKVPSTALLPMAPPKDATLVDLAEALNPMFPSGFHWASQSFVLDVEEDKLDYCALGKCIDRAAPGFSCIAAVADGKGKTARPGAYGGLRRGLVILSYGVFQEDDARGRQAGEDFSNAVAAVVEPAGPLYNTLEHPCSKENFERSFEDSAKICALREQLDPDKVFFDPSLASPYKWPSADADDKSHPVSVRDR